MFKFRDGFQVPEGITAEQVNNELERIREKYGILTSTIIVEESRHPSAVLHRCFVWNDTEAAERYRRQQASQLTRAVMVAPADEAQRTTSVFVLTMKDDQRQYVPMIEVQQDPDMLDYSIKLLSSHLRGIERTINDLLSKPLTKSQKAKAQRISKHISKALELGAGL